jgi:hypothetical protein
MVVDILLPDFCYGRIIPADLYSQVARSTIGDVLEMFNDTGLTHLPVMETTEGNQQRLRGLLSFAKVKRLLVDVA